MTDFDPGGWRIFDATDPRGRMTYLRWAQAQPMFSDLVLTVHSTQANHYLRNKFREDFRIDCVLFNPDQEAELHTDMGKHVWMAVTDWTPDRKVDGFMSTRLGRARFTVLPDEDFLTEETGLPIRKAGRQIENATETIPIKECIETGRARSDSRLPAKVIQKYQDGGYLHLFIEP